MPAVEFLFGLLQALPGLLIGFHTDALALVRLGAPQTLILILHTLFSLVVLVAIGITIRLRVRRLIELDDGHRRVKRKLRSRLQQVIRPVLTILARPNKCVVGFEFAASPAPV